MKKILLTMVLALTVIIQNANASCQTGFSEVIIQIIPDQFPWETSWNLTDNTGTIIASGTSVGDTVCIPTNSCAIFTIMDSFGDGIYSPGGYWIYVDGTFVATGFSFGYSATLPIGCPQGMFCSSSLPLSFGTFAASFDNTFYTYTPAVSGTYNITTCGMNACNTQIWVYDVCNGAMIDEGPPGSYAYNDDASCGFQAVLDVVMIAGSTYYVRIGDKLDDCPGAVNFTFSYVGPIQGCMDPTACNYNALAVVDDGSCLYYPDPGCAGPDLEIDSLTFVSSLSLTTITASGCDVDEGCVTGYGLRHVIQFTTKINNIGTLDYYIGNPGSQPTMFNTVNCHGHAHYEGYGDYRLYDMAGNLIPAGHKNGFCVIDLCGFGQYNCGNMGISVNCYDVYGAGTQCQWVDITDVPDGDYRMAVIINSHHLPDAFNHYEINHVNNATQICINITRNLAGIPSFTVLPSCTPYVDCMGIPGGAAMPDCNGVCAGPGIYGNLNGDTKLDSIDVDEYVNLLESNSGVASTCNDLNGDGSLSVYDAALALWCVNTPHHPHPAGSNFNDCNFPHDILNPFDSTGLAITNVNFASGYLDIELKSKTADIKAYQFRMKGITVSSVVSLASPVDFPVDAHVISGTNEIFAISQVDSALDRSQFAQPLCRIYFSAITDTLICIDQIRDIVNQDAERTTAYIYGNCFIASPTGMPELAGDFPVSLVPNPASDKVWLQLPEGIKPDKVDIIDMTGRVVNVKLTTVNGRYQLSLNGFSSGLYLLRAVTAAGTGYARFSKVAE